MRPDTLRRAMQRVRMVSGVWHFADCGEIPHRIHRNAVSACVGALLFRLLCLHEAKVHWGLAL